MNMNGLIFNESFIMNRIEPVFNLPGKVSPHLYHMTFVPYVWLFITDYLITDNIATYFSGLRVEKGYLTFLDLL